MSIQPKIKWLLTESGIKTYTIAKELGENVQTLDNYKNNPEKIDRMALGRAEKLAQYADKKKERFKDMTDFENDNFKVIEKVESHNQRVQWLCLCKHCGNTTVLNSSEIAKTKSCGCLKKGASAEYMAQIRDFESLKSTKPTKKNTTGVRGVYVRNRRGDNESIGR